MVKSAFKLMQPILIMEKIFSGFGRSGPSQTVKEKGTAISNVSKPSGDALQKANGNRRLKPMDSSRQEPSASKRPDMEEKEHEEEEKKEFIIEKDGKEVFKGEEPPFKIDTEKSMREGLLKNYGPGKYTIKSPNGGTIHFTGTIEVVPKVWTRRERKEHIRWRYYTLKEKGFVLLAFLVIFVFMFWIMSMALYTPDPFLLGFLILITGGLLVAAAFFIDMFFFETE